MNLFEQQSAEAVLKAVESFIPQRYLDYISLELRPGTGKQADLPITYLVMTYGSTVYRQSGCSTLARVYLGSKVQFVSFPEKSAEILRAYNVPVMDVPSDPWRRVQLVDFFRYADVLRDAFEPIFLSAFSFPTFGCCGKFEQCSDAGHCLHDDLIYAAAACAYKKNLDSGRVFYGKNKDI